MKKIFFLVLMPLYNFSAQEASLAQKTAKESAKPNQQKTKYSLVYYIQNLEKVLAERTEKIKDWTKLSPLDPRIMFPYFIKKTMSSESFSLPIGDIKVPVSVGGIQYLIENIYNQFTKTKLEREALKVKAFGGREYLLGSKIFMSDNMNVRMERITKEFKYMQQMMRNILIITKNKVERIGVQYEPFIDAWYEYLNTFFMQLDEQTYTTDIKVLKEDDLFAVSTVALQLRQLQNVIQKTISDEVAQKTDKKIEIIENFLQSHLFIQKQYPQLYELALNIRKKLEWFSSEKSVRYIKKLLKALILDDKSLQDVLTMSKPDEISNIIAAFHAISFTGLEGQQLEWVQAFKKDLHESITLLFLSELERILAFIPDVISDSFTEKVQKIVANENEALTKTERFAQLIRKINYNLDPNRYNEIIELIRPDAIAFIIKYLATDFVTFLQNEQGLKIDLSNVNFENPETVFANISPEVYTELIARQDQIQIKELFESLTHQVFALITRRLLPLEASLKHLLADQNNIDEHFLKMYEMVQELRVKIVTQTKDLLKIRMFSYSQDNELYAGNIFDPNREKGIASLFWTEGIFKILGIISDRVDKINNWTIKKDTYGLLGGGSLFQRDKGFDDRIKTLQQERREIVKALQQEIKNVQLYQETNQFLFDIATVNGINLLKTNTQAITGISTNITQIQEIIAQLESSVNKMNISWKKYIETIFPGKRNQQKQNEYIELIENIIIVPIVEAVENLKKQISNTFGILHTSLDIYPK